MANKRWGDECTRSAYLRGHPDQEQLLLLLVVSPAEHTKVVQVGTGSSRRADGTTLRDDNRRNDERCDQESLRSSWHSLTASHPTLQKAWA